MLTRRLSSGSACLALILAGSFSAGPVLGAEIDRIVSFSAGDPPTCVDAGPDVALQPGGSFLLTWQRSGCPILSSFEIRSQRFDAAGRPLAPAVKQWVGSRPQVVPLPNGGFAAISQIEPVLGPFIPSGIGLHRLDAFGRPIGEPIVVAIDPDSFDVNLAPRLAVAPNGSVAVVWLDATHSPNFEGVLRARFFDADFHPISDAILLSDPAVIPGSEIDPDISFQADGTALVVWTRYGAGTSSRIFGRRFSAVGEPLTEVFAISQLNFLQFHLRPRVLPRPDGGWWVGWNSHAIAPPFAALGLEDETRLVRLAADGSPLGVEQSIGIANPSESFALGTDAAGNLLALTTNALGAIFGQRVDPDGSTLSGLFNLSGSAPLTFRDPALADRSPAGFLAVWSGYSLPTQADSDLFGSILTPPCLEGKIASCLGPNGRYAVEIAWHNGAQSGAAKPLPFARNVATFGLRTAADHDVTVLLSGSGSRDLTFAATTGAALEIRVTDKTTGEVRTFNKPAGRFASGRFPSALPSLSGDAVSSTAPFVISEEEARLAPEPAVGETCVPTSRALCLLGGRFRAELLAGQSLNPALAILRTDKSGAFALPRASETPLVTLTMIDGRASNGKFWVYLGGLSASGYKVRITDLSAGVAKTYANPVGKLDSRADRTAF